MCTIFFDIGMRLHKIQYITVTTVSPTRDFRMTDRD